MASLRRLFHVALDEQALAIYKRTLSQSKLQTKTARWRLDKSLVQREAAVLMPVCKCQGVPSVLFTLRSSNLKSHSNEVSFPGGLREPQDVSLTETALRETEEEIYISHESIRVLGSLRPVPDKTQTISVTPFVAYLGEIGNAENIRFNQEEVSLVFSLPFGYLINPENRGTMNVRGYSVPFWHLPRSFNQQGNLRLWGLTAYIVHTSLDLLFVNNRAIYH